MAYVKAKEISTEDSYIQPNWNQGGIAQAYAETVNFDKASAYVDPLLLELQQMGGSRIAMAMIVPGGVYEFGSGTVSSPGIKWAADTDSGFYWISAGVFGVSIDGVNEVTFNSSGLRIADMTAGSVLFAGTSGQVSQDNTNLFFTDSTDTLKVGGGLRVGTATDTSTAGDFVAGLTGASRVFFDQSLQTLSIYDSGGAEDISLDAAADSWYNGTGNFGFGATNPGKLVEIRDAETFQLRLSYTSGTYTDIGTQSDGDLYINPASGVLTLENFPAVSGGDIELWVGSFDDAGGNTVLHLRNYDNAAGDAQIKFKVGAGSSYWSLGADNSDSDALALARGQVLGTTNRLRVSTDGYYLITPGAVSSGTAHVLQVTGAINTAGSNGLLKVLAAASTGQTTLTEIKFIDVDLSATTTWATGAITNERAISISAPTLAFAGASTVTNAATVYIDRAPQAGANATITNAYALWVDDGAVRLDGNLVLTGFTQGSVLFAGSSGVVSQNNGVFFWDNTNEVLVIGSTHSDLVISGTTYYPKLYLHNEAAGQAVMASFHKHSGTATSGTNVEYGRSRGSEATSTVVADNDSIARIGFTGFDGTDYERCAEILVNIDDATPSGTSMGGEILFRTSATGSVTPTTRMTIGANGATTIAQWLNVGTTTDATAQGDFSAGLVGARRIFWDESAASFYVRSTGSSQIFLQTTASGELGSDGFLLQSDGSGDAYVWQLESRPLYIGTSAALRMTVAANGATTIAQWLNVGTTTDAAAQGDFAAGLTGAARLFYDQSVPILYSYGSAGTIVNQLSSVASTATVFNEQGADIDFRVESDDESYCLMVEGTLNNIVMCANSEPGFNSMDGGVYLSDANVVPSGNPTGGGYLYSEGGALKWRGTSGTVTTIAAA